MKSEEQQIAKLHNAARKAMRTGRLGEAHQHCLAILKLDQAFTDAWFFCGVIAAHNGQLAKAVDILGNAINLAPDNAEYRAELGKQLLALNHPEQALLEAEAALRLEPDDLPTLNTLGTVFSHTGEHEKALLCFERVTTALQQSPERAARLSTQWQADLYFNTAASRQFAGQFEAAEQDYEQAIALQPHHFKAHFALSTLRTQSPRDNHLARLESIRAKASSPRDQLQLGHAIAKEQEDLGHYAETLQSLHWAKRAQARQVSYCADTDAALFTHVKALFSSGLLNKQDSGCDSSEPIFIVGMPRTGTTLVEQVLSSHSQVYAAGELQNFPLQLQRLTGSTAADVLEPGTFGESLRLDMAELGSRYIASTRPRTGHTPHFIDKLPLNFLYLGLIKLALPNAKLVCLRRDPMDTCLSNYRQLFAMNFRHYHYNYDLLDCGRYYIQFDSLMRHWHAVMPGAVHEVSYEALVENPEQVSRELLNYCDLAWEDQCLDFHQRKTSVATPSAVQVRQGIYTSSVKRWQRYGDAMQPLYELLESAGFYP
jgi:tetratricopeptide (TPR) repeat protein